MGVTLLVLAAGMCLAVALAVLPGLGPSLSEADIYRNAPVCPRGQSVGTGPCLVPVPATLVYSYTSGSRSRSYYIRIATPAGASGDLSVTSTVYNLARAGARITAFMWRGQPAIVWAGNRSSTTQADPSTIAVNHLLGVVVSLSAMAYLLGWAWLTLARAFKRGISADLTAGPVVYRPSPTLLSRWLRPAWMYVLGLILACFLYESRARGASWVPVAVAAALGILIVKLLRREELELSTSGLVHRIGGRVRQNVPWSMVVGIRTFGYGRSRYQAIALADGTRIRHAYLLGCTAANESLKWTIAERAGAM